MDTRDKPCEPPIEPIAASAPDSDIFDHMTDTKGDRVREFFRAETEALVARFQNIERLLPHEDRAGSAHPGEEGRFVEELVKSFLRRHLPAQVGIGTGFVLRVATKIGSDDNSRAETESDRHSRQLDVIVYDKTRFPIYETFGDFVIVPPEAVVGIISVKKTLYSSQLNKELRTLQETASLCAQPNIRGPHTGLLAFQCEPTKTPDALADDALNALKSMSSISFETLANEVSVLQQFVLFKFLPNRGKKSAPYRLIQAQGADGHIVLQRVLQSILGVFYDPTRQAAPARPGFVSFHKGTFGSSPCLGEVPFARWR